MNKTQELLQGVPVPKMAKVRQKFDKTKIEDIPAAMCAQLLKPAIRQTIKPGMRVAITAGSRGIRNMAACIREIAAFIRESGASPFVIPAMGSHGGATASGQLEVLSDYGITEETIGVPIVSSMEVAKIGELEDNTPVYIDRYASEADGIVVINRIKVHPSFSGKYESGLMKMIAIGLAKQQGAEVCHARGFGEMEKRIELFGKAILKHASILFGVGLIENAFDETAEITALLNEEIPVKEPALLEHSKTLMPRILFDNLDTLVIDYIGKNISGAGADPNITGMKSTKYSKGGIRCETYAVLDLTEETHGNGAGVGMATATTRRLIEKTDFDKMYVNGLTSLALNGVMVPYVLENQKQAIQAALKLSAPLDRERPRMVRIRDSLSLKFIEISEALLEEARQNPDVEILSEAQELCFDEHGDLF